jgi:hypothetical protein
MVHEGVHGAQQMLVGHALGYRRHRDSAQPAQPPNLLSGAQSRMNTIAHTRASTSIRRLPEHSACTSAQSKPNSFQIS